MFQIEEELKKLPGKPGVYIMHGEKDEIIYVGKAVSLKNRVRQYFQSSRNKGAKIEQMVTHITRFEYIITDSELEALVLECNLIKEHRPKYNTMLKDDKSYPFIKVTVNEEYPRVLFARRMKKDKAKYFGPYTSAGAVKDVIELVRKLYKVRSCNRVLPRDCGKDRPCLYYHMKQCSAPCQGFVSSEEYKKNIAELLKFLNGDFKDTIDMLTDKMMAASEEMRFEDAMEYRDLIRSIQKIGERQKITGYGEEDKDIIAVAMDESLDLREQDAVVQVFFVRGGKLIGREHFYLRVARGDTKAQVLSSFMKQFYAGTPFIPREIMLQKEIEDAKIIEEWLTDRRKQRVYIRVPKKGTKEKLVELAEENAKMVLDKDRERIKREEGRTIGAVHEVEEWLGLSGIRRMEAYDISNISGFESVGSMVVYEKGKPKRSDYRKFKIKWVQGPNDYASMEEVLTRRFTHEGKDEFDSFSIMPDLILMDNKFSDMEGLALIQWFREWTDAPIIVLSEQNSYLDKVEALYAGADDYMVKPFHEKELAARIFSALRRRISTGAHTYYEAGNLKVDFTKRQVLLGGMEIHFSPVEYRIIESLALNAGTVVTYQMLLEKIWGPYAEQNSRILRVNMTNIRKKIERSPLEPEYITTIPRVGYRMLESQTSVNGMQMMA